jgi:hypothetical protein
MISVIVYGRNDSHGYNLPKRAAISLNCIAEVLEEKDDEIIFVDCNTPNEIPTFPESIADTLTPAAKRLLRVLRLRPEQYGRHCKNGVKFKVQESLCRNVAIRRSNPHNRWILNTNTDMVFTPLSDGLSLSRIACELRDGFYELPRFEIPESLWESVNRMEPQAIINSFKRWGLRLHLNEIITDSKEALFDGPGDFQLCLRSQLMHIHGMNESMVLWAHIDSNLCKRMWLLNGETNTILDKMYGFHCDHTRFRSIYHAAGESAANDYREFVISVASPYLPGQADTWGMPDERVEEIVLDGKKTVIILNALEKIVPGMDRPISNLSVGCNFFENSLYYDNAHVFAYLADIVTNLSPQSDMGYVGNNLNLLNMLAEYRRLIGHSGRLYYSKECLLMAATNESGNLPSVCQPADHEFLYKEPPAIILDLSMKNFPSRLNGSGLRVPQKCPEVQMFVDFMSSEIVAFARHEKDLSAGGEFLRPFIFAGCHATSFDGFIQTLFSCAMTPCSTHIRIGTLSPAGFETPLPIFPIEMMFIEATLQEIGNWISHHLGRPVSSNEIIMAYNLYNMFATVEGKTALDALETLLSFDAGRGILEMHIEILQKNGVPGQGDTLRNFIREYETRPCL